MTRIWRCVCVAACRLRLTGCRESLVLFTNMRASPVVCTDSCRWLSEGALAVKGAWQEHVVEPLNNIKSELFKTFRDRPCDSIVSIEVKYSCTVVYPVFFLCR